MKAAVLILLAAVVVLARAYWVSCRKVDRRDARIASLTAELTLTQEACDAQAVKVRHFSDQAKRYHAEASRLSARNAELRDQLDEATGAVRPPAAIEEFTAWLAELPTAEEREYPL